MGDGARVAMYVPKAGGGLELAEAWQVRRRLEPYEVCGPPGKALPNGSEPGEHAACPARTAAGAANLGVGVDQTSGQVYVFGGFSSHEIEQDGGGYEVVVYTADAGEEVTRFGELDLEARTIAETPEKMHSGNSNSSLLAVDSATGDVYVYDEVATGLFYSRLMVFGPHEGDRSEYEYLGEVLAGEGVERKSRAPVLDDAGHLYVAGIQETGDHIEEFAPQTPASYPAPEATPLCSFHYEKGGLEAMTVDPETGEPFFYSYKRETKAHWLRRLSACDEGSGEFTETAKMAIAPERGDLFALAFDPERRAEPSRGKGVLYGGVPNTEFQSGEGEASQSSLGYVYGQPKGPAKTLTVSKGGGGAGSVTSDPIGIECGSLCSQEFEEGETLTLIATAAEGSTFSGWSGECASVSGNECEVTMSAVRSVEASFEEEGGGPTEYPLSTHVTGEGTIECAPPGGDCGAGHEYLAGTTVTLTAVADEGWEFLEWSGACAGTLLPACEVTIEAAIDVGAVFGEVPTPEHTLTVSVSGEGEVSADVGTISGCTSAGGPSCEGSYEEGATVTLTETPAGGSHFVSWATPQCDESSASSCEVTIGSGDEAVAASFEADSVSGPPLTVAIEEGEGTVVSDPAGIDCTGAAPKSCETEAIEAGTVTLTASPAPGYAFKNWRHCDKKSGQFGINGRQCVIDLSEAKEVGANFTAVDSLTLSKASGSGPGQLNTKPGGIACTYNCQSASASFKHGSQVSVVEKPAKHFHFVELTGGTGSAASCNGSSSETCTFTINGASSIEAKFAEDPKHALSLAKSGGGQALIKTKGPGIVCSYTCSSASASFYEGEVVEVRWKLAKGTSSLEWGTGSGTCTGTETEAEGACTVTMSAARSLVAQLE